jgi:TolB protein
MFHVVSRQSIFAGIAAAAFATVCVLTATAGATAPGANGKIAFRRYFDPKHSWGAVFTVNSNGTGVRQITHPARGLVDDQPSWAPDGSLITFTRCAPGKLCHVWVVAPDGTGLAPVGALCPDGADEQSCSDDANGTFSPDSKRIVFTQSTGPIKPDPVVENIIEHSAITTVNRDGSNRHVLYQGPPYSGDLSGAAFSPDGKQVVFEGANSGASKPAGKRAVFVVSADGTGLRRLTPWAENAGDHPDWSPNGKWIVFHSHVDDPHGQGQFFLVLPDGSGRKQLTHFSAGTWVGRASFSPDGKSIVFGVGPDGRNAAVYTMRLDGSHVRRVTKSKLWNSAPSWGPR